MDNTAQSTGKTSLLLRNLFFTILQPGMVAGFFPWLIARGRWAVTLSAPLGIWQYAGLIVFLAGLVVTLHCILRFALEGKGTLSPADPTRQLVTSGLYRYTRNPMYIGVMLLLIGECIFVSSLSLWIYSLFIFTAFNLFIVFWEEPRLRKDFGPSYIDYCRKVRRWL